MSDESTTEQPQTVDLDGLKAAILEAIKGDNDKRFQGLQGLMDRRDAELRKELEDLKTADLEPEQREQVQASRLEKELADSKRQIEILSKRKDFPEEVDLLTEFMNADSLEKQLALLAAFRKVTTAPKSLGDEAVEEAAPVDGNNPRRGAEASISDVGEMTAAKADKLIGSSDEGGILARLRRGYGGSN